jgi:hypothetical protein
MYEGAPEKRLQNPIGKPINLLAAMERHAEVDGLLPVRCPDCGGPLTWYDRYGPLAWSDEVDELIDEGDGEEGVGAASDL